MKIRTKKILAFTLAATMILTSAPTHFNYAAEEEVNDNVAIEQTVEVEDNNDEITTENTSEAEITEDITTEVIKEEASSEEASSEANSEEVTSEETVSEDATATDATSEETTESLTEETTTEEATSEESDEDTIVVFDHIFNDIDTSNIKTKDLFVQTSNSKVFTKNTNVVSNYDNVYIISCVSVDEAKSVYSYYVDKVDFISDLQDTMTLSETDNKDEISEDTKSDKDVADLSDVNKDSDDAIAAIEDVEKDLNKDNYEGYIALIDSGVNTSGINDTDLKTVSVVDNSDATDKVGHGTKMYNYIKEENPNAKILSIKAFDSSTSNVADIYAAIRLAIDSKVSVINLSFTGFVSEQNQPIVDIINEAINSGITVIGAAGNFSSSAKLFIPGCVDDVVTIGAVNKDQTLHKVSNYDADLYVIASSTSEATARYTGIFTSNTTSDKVFDTYVDPEDKNDEFKDNDISKGKVTTDKTYTVKYLYVDKSMLNGLNTIDDIYEQNPDAIIYQAIENPTVYKQDDVYMFYADTPWKSGIADGNVLDYCFANSNDNGEVITENVKLDINTKIAYIDKDAFENNDFSDGQLQILVPINIDAKTSINVNIYNKNNTKIFTDTWTLDIFDDVNISLNKDISKDDVISVKYNNIEGKFDVENNTIITGKFAIDINTIDIILNTNDSFILASYDKISSLSGNGSRFATYNLSNYPKVWKRHNKEKKEYTYKVKYYHNKSDSEVDSNGIYTSGVDNYDGTLWAIRVPYDISRDYNSYVRAACSHLSKPAYISSQLANGTEIKATFNTIDTYKSGDWNYAIIRILTNSAVCGTEGGKYGQSAIAYIRLKYREESCLKSQKVWEPVAGTQLKLGDVAFRVKKGSTTIGYAKSNSSTGNFKSVFKLNALKNNKWNSNNYAYSSGHVIYPAGTKLTLDELGIPLYNNSGTLCTSAKQVYNKYNTTYATKTYNSSTKDYDYAIKSNVRTENVGGTVYYFAYPTGSYSYDSNGDGKNDTTVKLQVSENTLLRNVTVKTIKPSDYDNNSVSKTILVNGSSYVHLALYKTDHNNEALPNATFRFYLYTAPNTYTYICDGITNSNGVLAINNTTCASIISGGTYYAQEIASPSGYKLPTNPDGTLPLIGPLIVYNGDLDSTDNNSDDVEDITFNDLEGQYTLVNNTPITRYAAVKKVDEDGNPIQGVTFNASLQYYTTPNDTRSMMNMPESQQGQNITQLAWQCSSTAYINTAASRLTTDENGIAYVAIENLDENETCAVTFTESGGSVWNYQDENGNYPNRYYKFSMKVDTALNASSANLNSVLANAASYKVNNKNHVKLELQKVSANPSYTDGNPNYDLTGAEFNVFTTQNAAQEAINTDNFSGAIATFVTKKDGSTDAVDISKFLTRTSTGYANTTWYVVESKVPNEGYKPMDPDILPIQIDTSKGLNKFTIADPPVEDPLTIKVIKRDSFGDIDTNYAGKVKFSYKFYPLSMTNNILTRDQVIKSGIEPNKDFSGSVEADINGSTITIGDQFPRGYVVIDEIEWPSDCEAKTPKMIISTPDGKEIDITNDAYFVTDAYFNEEDYRPVRASYYPNGATTYEELNTKGIKFATDNSNSDTAPKINISAYNYAIRGDISLKKVDSNGDPVEGIKFSIKNVLTGETHYIFTDKDGIATTKVEGRYHEGDKEVFNYYDTHEEYNPDVKAEVWFSKGKDGTEKLPSQWIDKDITPGALWGSVTPKDGDTNKAEFRIGDYVIKEERCKANNNNELKFQLEPSKAFHIYTNDEEYLYTDSNAAESEGKIWNMPMPTISTKAKVVQTSDSEDDLHQTLAQEGGDIDYKNQTINDIVTYTNLRANTDYTYLTELMIVDKNGNIEPYIKDGKALRIVTPFTTANHYKHSIYEISDELTIPIEGVDPTGLEEEQKKLVVYETLYLGKYETLEALDTAIEEQTYATRYEGYTDNDSMDMFPLEHKNPNDDYQTVRPADVHTTISNNVNLDRIAHVDPVVTLTDRVYYTGLTPGKEYTVEGKLIVKDYGATTKVTYDPKNPDADEDGFVTVTEEDTNNSDNTNNTDNTDNTDNNNQNTTDNSSNNTNQLADQDESNSSDNSQNTDNSEDNSNNSSDEDIVEDKVESKSAYVLRDGEGNVIKVSKSFTPETHDGYVDIEFTVDASQLQNKSTVAFETLSYKNMTIAVHADLNDEDETVHFPEIGTTTYNSEIKLDDNNLPIIEETTTEESTSTTEETTTDNSNTTNDATTDQTSDTNANTSTDVNTNESTSDASTIEETTTEESNKFDDADKATFKQVEAEKNKSFYDRINYKNLLANRTYIAKGVLMDKATGEVMKDAADKEIRAELVFKTNEVGEVVLDKSPNAVNYVLEDGTIMDLTADNADYMCNGYVDLLFEGYDFSNLDGKIGTVFEEVYLLNTDKIDDSKDDSTSDENTSDDSTIKTNLLVASHKDIEDIDQFVYFIEAKTNAKDLTTNEKIVPYDMETVIEDTVTYKNVIPGKEYKLKATLHVKNDKSGVYKDGDVLLDANQKPIEVETTFIPETTDGSTIVKIPINTKDLRSLQIVVFENMYNKYGIEVAAHCDLEDVDQTVEVPDALTSASITSFEDMSNITLVDTISYNNFVPGRTYIAKGYLVDQATDERVQSNGEDITAETTFIPEKKDDTVDVTFNFSGEELSGRYVVFEEIYIETTDVDTNTSKEVLVAQHKDLTDEKQTVEINLYMNIQIAKADRDNIKYFLKGAEITLYTADGEIAKDTDGNDCVGVTDEDGTVSFDVTYGTYYAMETKAPNGYYISKEKYEVTPTFEGREDVVTDIIKINILDEIIVIPPKTGETMPIIPIIIVLAIGATGIVLFTRKRKDTKKSE